MTKSRVKFNAMLFFSFSVMVHAAIFYAWQDLSLVSAQSKPDKQLRVTLKHLSLPETIVESFSEPEEPPLTKPQLQRQKEKLLLVEKSNEVLTVNQVEPEKVLIEKKAVPPFKQPKPRILKTKPKEIVKKMAPVKTVVEPLTSPVVKNDNKAKVIDIAVSAKAPETELISESQVKADYLTYLYQRIRDNKFYPGKARKWRAEGRVVVSFVIGRNGKISQLEVTDTSGNRYLDKAALTTIRKIEPLKALPILISDTSWNLKVPLDYQLIN